MQNNPKPQDYPLQQAMLLAKSPAGQQLIAMLQKQGENALQDAMNKAAAGDYAQAKQMLQALLEDPEAKALLNELGRK